jgi:glycosyltransferase involved in cell wall biosynthesis
VERAEGAIDRNASEAMVGAFRRAISDILDRFPVDVVHMHGVDFFRYLPPPGPIVLATLHLPPTFYPPEVFAIARPKTHLNCVSTSQLRACPPCEPPLAVVPNGIALESFRRRTQKEPVAMALGRICPEKGFHLAIDAAKAAGVDLVLAGELFRYPEHVRYFENEIVPRLDRRRRFVGQVGVAEKRDLLSRARCLLVPSLVPETSSLVAMESLASGTPVVAAPVGALPDIVDHGRTGFLASGVEETADAIARADRIDGRMCRAVAEERFGAKTMTRGYLGLYERLIHARS